MAKIRVQDLARMMQIPEQDLVFKLRSLGVRVEGQDAGIEAEALQAILQGKKLSSPREVIMDDGAAAPPPPARPAADAAAQQRRPAVNPLRPSRPRTIIQKVEPRIMTLPSSQPDRAGTPPVAPPAPGLVPAVEPAPAAPPVAPAPPAPAPVATPTTVVPASASPSTPAAHPVTPASVSSASAAVPPVRRLDYPLGFSFASQREQTVMRKVSGRPEIT